jgi:UDP-glucose 4-epimerase
MRHYQGAIAEAPLGELLDEGVTHVFHLAGQPGVRDSWGAGFRAYAENNILATQQLLEACVGRSIERIVVASTSAVYGHGAGAPSSEVSALKPVSPYGASKVATEQLCEVYREQRGVPTVRLRYFTVYGPGQRLDMAFARFIAAAAQGDPITVYGDGTQTRDFTFIDDVIAGTLAAAERGQVGAVYNIGGGCRTTLNEAIEILCVALNTYIQVDHVAAQSGDARDTAADIRLARKDLGFMPRMTLVEGLYAQVAAARAGHTAESTHA